MSPDKKGLVYPPDRPWVEFVIIMILCIMCFSSMVSLLISARESKIARVAAITRLDFIYKDLISKDNELRKLKIQAIDEERAFHYNLSRSMKTQSQLLKQNAIKLNVPISEIDKILNSDPIYSGNP